MSNVSKNNKNKTKNNNNNNNSSSKSDDGIMAFITNYESLIIFGGFGALALGVIILAGMFQAGPIVRENTVYNAAGAMCMAFGFIYLIFASMGETVMIIETEVDMGMVIYIAIVLFVMFVLGN
jgi:hypothetical protein